MYDSYLMGLQLFLLMLLSQTAWERLVRRDPKAGSPCTASSATAAAGPEGGRSGGRPVGSGATSALACLCLPWSRRHPFPEVGERHECIGTTFLGILCHWGNPPGFLARSLGQVGRRHPACSVVKSDLFFFCDTDLILPARFLPISSSRSQLCLMLSPCLKSGVFLQLSVTGLSALMTNSFHGPLHACCLLHPL